MPAVLLRMMYLLLAGIPFWIGCETPTDQVARLQHELLTLLQQQEYFEIKAGKQVLQWPLPPSAAASEASRQTFEKIQLELQSIDTTQLAGDKKNAVRFLQTTAAEMAAKGGGVSFDPLQCVVRQQLEAGLKDPAQARVLLQEVGNYYREVEKRWQTPAPARAIQAARESIHLLDLLENHQAPEASLLAVKDFIACCRCVVLN